MTPDQVASMAEKLAHYLTVLAMIPGVPGATAIAAGAAALHNLAANPAECQAIAQGADLAVQGAQAAYAAFQAIIAWLRNSGHADAAAALLAVQ